jgi:hypothetical protein
MSRVDVWSSSGFMDCVSLSRGQKKERKRDEI